MRLYQNNPCGFTLAHSLCQNLLVRGITNPHPSGCRCGKSSLVVFAEALRLYGSQLTAFERTEIENYPEVYYLGLEAKKIHGEEGGNCNGGYDDENGSYHKVRKGFLMRMRKQREM